MSSPPCANVITNGEILSQADSHIPSGRCQPYPDLKDGTVSGHDLQKYVIHHFHIMNNTKHSPVVHPGYEDRMRDFFLYDICHQVSSFTKTLVPFSAIYFLIPEISFTSACLRKNHKTVLPDDQIIPLLQPFPCTICGSCRRKYQMFCYILCALPFYIILFTIFGE